MKKIHSISLFFKFFLGSLLALVLASCGGGGSSGGGGGSTPAPSPSIKFANGTLTVKYSPNVTTANTIVVNNIAIGTVKYVIDNPNVAEISG